MKNQRKRSPSPNKHPTKLDFLTSLALGRQQFKLNKKFGLNLLILCARMLLVVLIVIVTIGKTSGSVDGSDSTEVSSFEGISTDQAVVRPTFETINEALL